MVEVPIRGARSVAAKLAAAREDAFLSRQLATLARDAPIDAKLADLRYEGARPTDLDPLLARLGFEGIRRRVTRWKS